MSLTVNDRRRRRSSNRGVLRQRVRPDRFSLKAFGRLDYLAQPSHRRSRAGERISQWVAGYQNVIGFNASRLKNASRVIADQRRMEDLIIVPRDRVVVVR